MRVISECVSARIMAKRDTMWLVQCVQVAAITVSILHVV